MKRMKFILPVLSVFAAFYGLFHYLKNDGNNNCDMTYMFEYPEYLKIPLNYSSAIQFPRYNLFAYAEGKYAQDLSAERFEGFPVLFIPGNGGSHRQVRSLASVALRMSQSYQTNIHFNFFAIDFNEELSALYGGTLIDQTKFVLECIKHVQALYSTKKKLILIGHSMGGVVGKAVFFLPSFDPNDISIILTLASPHYNPVIALDYDIVSFYEKIKEAWKYRLKLDLKDIPVISVGGGRRDAVVRSDLIVNNFQHASNLDVHVLTSAVPGVWLSTDHLAIVWCKQLVLTICRSLFDLSRPEIAKTSENMESILKFHYVSKSSGSFWSPLPQIPYQVFPSTAQWIKQDDYTWRFSRSKILSSIYIFVPFLKKSHVLIVTSGLIKSDWIYACTRAIAETCLEGENMSNKGEIIPSRKAKVERRKIHFSIEDLQKNGFVALVIYISPAESQVEILGETYSEVDRTRRYPLPSLFDRIFSIAPHRIFTISLVEQVVHYNVSVLRSAGVFQSVEFQLETRLCRAGSVVGQGLVKMQVPWSNEDSYHHISTSLGGVTRIPAIVHSLPPADVNPNINLVFILDPECSLVLTARFPFYLMASQFVKFYGIHVLGYTVAVLLFILSDHLSSLASEGVPHLMPERFGKISSFTILVLLPSILHHSLWIFDPSALFIPQPDALDESSNYFALFVLRSVLFFIASGLALGFYCCIECLLNLISAIWRYFQSKTILEKTQKPLQKVLKDRFEISKSTLIWSSVVGAICLGVSSSLAAAMMFVYYMFKLACMYTIHKLEEDRRGPSVASRKWCLHILLVLLCLFTVLLTVPGLVVWSSGYLRFSLRLSRDVYLVPCAAIVVSLTLLWQLPAPVFHRYRYDAIALEVRVISLLVTLYGVSSVYRLLYAIAVVFASLCIQQAYACFRSSTYQKKD